MSAESATEAHRNARAVEIIRSLVAQDVDENGNVWEWCIWPGPDDEHRDPAEG